VRMELVPNPFAGAWPVEEGAAGGDLEVTTPRPKDGLKFGIVSRQRDGSLYDAIAAATSPDGSLRPFDLPSLSPTVTGRLYEMGLLVDRKLLPAWPKYCSTLPASSRAVRSTAPTAALRECRDLLGNNLYFAGAPTMSVEDPVTGLAFPYWGPRRPTPAARIRRPDAVRTSRPREKWRGHVERATDSMAKHGYACVRGALPPAQMRALRAYYGALVEGGFLEFYSKEARWVKHNDHVARVFHRLLLPLATRIAHTPVKPSYAFLSAYKRGAELLKHTDRPQCEYTLALLVDFHPRPSKANGELAWPLYLENPDSRPPRARAFKQRIGDLIMFRGTRLAHHRRRLRSADWSIHLLFHYVHMDFAGSLD
jgi:hypothetical protein